MSYTRTHQPATQDVIDIGKIDLGQHIRIADNWYYNITYQSGKSNLLAASAMGLIFSWYLPKMLKVESAGRLQVLGPFRSFDSDILQLTVSVIVERFGATDKQARDALNCLVEHGLIEKVLKNVTLDSGRTLPNVQFIKVYPQVIKLYTESIIPECKIDRRTGEKGEPTDGSIAFSERLNHVGHATPMSDTRRSCQTDLPVEVEMGLPVEVETYTNTLNTNIQSTKSVYVLGTSSADDAQNTHTPSADSENNQADEELATDEPIVEQVPTVDPNQLLQDATPKTTLQHSAEMYPGASLAQLQRMNRYATGEPKQVGDPLLAKWVQKGIAASEWSLMIQEVANRTGATALIDLEESDFADRKLNDIKGFLDSLLGLGRRFWSKLGVAMLFESYAANSKFTDPKFGQLLEHASQMVAELPKRKFAVIDGAVREVNPEAEAEEAKRAAETKRREALAKKRKEADAAKAHEEMLRVTGERRARLEAAERAKAAKQSAA